MVGGAGQEVRAWRTAGPKVTPTSSSWAGGAGGSRRASSAGCSSRPSCGGSTSAAGPGPSPRPCSSCLPHRRAGARPSAGFVEEARRRVVDPRAEFRVGTAEEVPADVADVAVSGLVLNFVPDPDAAVARDGCGRGARHRGGVRLGLRADGCSCCARSGTWPVPWTSPRSTSTRRSASRCASRPRWRTVGAGGAGRRCGRRASRSPPSSRTSTTCGSRSSAGRDRRRRTSPRWTTAAPRTAA